MMYSKLEARNSWLHKNVYVEIAITCCKLQMITSTWNKYDGNAYNLKVTDEEAMILTVYNLLTSSTTRNNYLSLRPTQLIISQLFNANSCQTHQKLLLIVDWLSNKCRAIHHLYKIWSRSIGNASWCRFPKEGGAAGYKTVKLRPIRFTPPCRYLV